MAWFWRKRQPKPLPGSLQSLFRPAGWGRSKRLPSEKALKARLERAEKALAFLDPPNTKR